MSMHHKAFIFDAQAFQSELLPILEKALWSRQASELVTFVEQNRASLTDPYEGLPLEEDWRDLVESQDPDQYGDYCLTKFYNPQDDRGVGSDWLELSEILEDESPGSSKLFLGSSLNVGGRLFDPGKMGSYFLSKEQVGVGLEAIVRVKPKASVRRIDLSGLERLYRDALAAGRGLYVTF